MGHKRHIVLTLLACLSAAVIFPATSRAFVNLDVTVSFAILDRFGIPLVDGSWVDIVISADGTADPLFNLGTPGNPAYIAHSVTGDDLLLATVRIGDNVAPNTGRFFAMGMEYDDSVYNYIYLRFYDNTNFMIGGTTYWGTSTIVLIPGQTLGVSTLEITEQLQTTLTNRFVVIPEPSTGNLFILVVGMILAMRVGMKKGPSRNDVAKGGGPA